MDTIFKFDPKGHVVKSFGAGMFIWPHGLHLDREGNVWVTDAVGSQGVGLAAKAGVRAGHQIFKFSPDGKLLMTLGEAGVPGDDQYHFRSPSAVSGLGARDQNWRRPNRVGEVLYSGSGRQPEHQGADRSS